MPDFNQNHEKRLFKPGDLVLVVATSAHHVTALHATLLEFMASSNEQTRDCRFVFCQDPPRLFEPTDYKSKMPPRIMLTGHFKEEGGLKGWRFPITEKDEVYVGTPEILKYLENSPGFEAHAAALRETLYQIQRRQGINAKRGPSETSENSKSLIYDCEICGVSFKYGRGELGVYQFMNCPNAFMTGDPSDLRCKKLDSKICPNF